MNLRGITAAMVALLLLGCAGATPRPAPATTPAAPSKAPSASASPASAATIATPAIAPAPAPAPPRQPGPRPLLVPESISLNLGEVKEGEDAVGTFKLRNTGDAELKILSARPG